MFQPPNVVAVVLDILQGGDESNIFLIQTMAKLK